MFKRFALIAILAIATFVGAHAHLAEAPETVAPGETFTFTLTEPIELLFSEFRVFAISEEEAETFSEADFIALLDTEAEEGVQGVEVTQDKELDYKFHITFENELEPGTYVLVWNVLSIDTHSSKEHYVFEVVAAN